MQYTRLGSSGLQVSRICLGMMSYGSTAERAWHLPEDAAEPIVARAVDAGVMFFDTADVYSDGLTEEITGRLLAKLFRSRDDYVLATKVYFPMGPGPNDRGLSRKHVLASIDASLRRLGTDYVDIYQIHRWDYGTPIEETMQALHDVVRAGQGPLHRREQHVRLAVRQGAAHRPGRRMDPVQLDAEPLQPGLPGGGAGDAAALPGPGRGRHPVEPAGPRPARGQPARDGAGPQQTVRAGSDPLAGEMYTSDDFDVVDAVRAVAAARGVPAAQVALSWLLRQPAVSAPIVGATRLAHLEDAIAAVDLTLDDAEAARLEAPYRPHRVLGHS